MRTAETNDILVVTGTDTGVGKTFVAAGLARSLVLGGHRVVAVKPVESGCGPVPTEKEDGHLLAQATGQARPRAAFERLRAALAPPAAAEREGRILSMDPWCERIGQLAKEAQLILVEGAGGLLSPLTWRETSLDLALRCRARVLVVAADRLGALNHVLLTLRVLQQMRLTVVGVVVSAPELPDAATGSNADALRRFAGLDRVFVLPRLSDRELAAERLAPVGDWVLG